MAADVIVTDSGIMHVAGVPLVNPSTVVVWEVMPGPGNGFQATTKIAVGCAIPPSLNPPSWAGFAPFAAYLFSLQEHFISEEKQGRKLTEHEINDVASLHCSPVSNFSAYVSPEAAAQSAATTTWGSGVTAVAFDPTRGGSVITVVIVEVISDELNSSDCSVERTNRLSFDPYDLPNDVRQLARIVYSAHGGEVAVAFLRGGVHVFSGANFNPVSFGGALWLGLIGGTPLAVHKVLLRMVLYLPRLTLLVTIHPTYVRTKDSIIARSGSSVIEPQRARFALPGGKASYRAYCQVTVVSARYHVKLTGNGRFRAVSAEGGRKKKRRTWISSRVTRSVARPPRVTRSIAYVDAVLDLASHFITRLRRYASFCRTLASHAVGASSGASSARNMVASPTHTSVSPSTSSQSGVSSANGNSQMQAWVQGAIAKISNNADGGSSTSQNPISGPASFTPISINTGTFPGTPAVRLIGDCHFLHKLCQLLLFCLIFRRRQSPRFIGSIQKNPDSMLQKVQPASNGKIEETSAVSRPTLGVAKTEEGQLVRTGQLTVGAKGLEEGTISKSVRFGSGNAGQGYTSEEVKVLFLILVDLCRRTAGLQHPLPTSQVGANTIIIRLHYIDGNYTVLPEVVEASLGPHMQVCHRFGYKVQF
ncbi:hypothetical protein BHE74_00012890 [Ensete ventricosum]|nr:hypothetical protein BHE74_00012890 [Ensete ventricosum]